jgi:pimeloyl-ACP methyl ester carboxylesterase
MLDLLDLLLLKRGLPSDDQTLTFRRIDGDPNAKVIYFLPWHTPFSICRQAGFTPLDFLASYEMPCAIVSSDPGLGVEAMRLLVADAEALLLARGVAPSEALIVGLSVGSYPAIYLANRIGARLCAVAAADRGDLMLWQSPATRIIKRRAIHRGVRLWQFSKAMLGYHPAQNLAGIARGSVFVVGDRDPFVPTRRRAGLLQAIERFAPAAHIASVAGGHVKTLMLSAHYQQAMLGLANPRKYWWIRLGGGPLQRAQA